MIHYEGAVFLVGYGKFIFLQDLQNIRTGACKQTVRTIGMVSLSI